MPGPVSRQVIPFEASPAVQRSIINELDILRKVVRDLGQGLTLQCRSDGIIEYFGAYFCENRIKICTEYMDGV